VDTHGTGGDETAYSDAVAARWQLRNETIVNPPVWRDDESQPPCLDEPNASQMLYPRERRLSAVVKAAGGRVLLTGMAGDTLFTGTMFFFADWLVEGRLIAAGREMLRRAMIGRVSFWELAYRNAVLPLLPLWLQHRLVQDAGQVPPWLSKGAIRRYELRDRSYVDRCYGGRLGHKYADSVAAGIEMMAAGQTSGLLEDTLDVRHPFLYRPLVEFALRLPAEWCVVPQQRKQILRDAMRGLLPEIVRSRVGKGALHARLAESLTTERSLLDSLLEEPILASLGLIDPAGLRAFVRGAQQRPESRQRLHSAVHHTLAVEAWLQTRSGRWACGDGVNNDPQFQ
jgi:asparagine synthase (glutamine-hydrolysing)